MGESESVVSGGSPVIASSDFRRKVSAVMSHVKG